MNSPILQDFLIILAVAVAVLLICSRFRIPLVVGLLLTGVLTGPYGFKLINDVGSVGNVANIGIVLLLFSIGVEMSLKEMTRNKRVIFVVGPLQVITTTAVVTALTYALGLPVGEAIFFGMMAAMSSTAIAMKSYQEQGEGDSPHARSVVTVLVFQDIASIPMLLTIPVLVGTAAGGGGEFLKLLAYGVGMIVFVFAASRWIAPYVLDAVASTRNRELFLMSIVLICLGVAWFSSAVGLSLALGAFLAGLIVSESDYSHHALGNIAPFRDLFTSLFFVSVGMLLDFRVVFEQPLVVAPLAVGVVLLKAVLVVPICLAIGYPLRVAVLTGVGLSNVGEFAFILASAGLAAGLLEHGNYQIFLAVSAVSMGAAPFLIRLAPRLAQNISHLPYARLERANAMDMEMEREQLSDHLIIVGFGVNGNNLALASQAVSIPYVVLEMNPETIKRARASGERIFFGDATQALIWEKINVHSARMVVIAISDPEATRRAVSVVRSMNAKVRIVARTRYLTEIETLARLGADEVIPEEFETSVEIFTRVLRYYLIPEDEINQIVHEVRSHNYEIFRTKSSESALQRIESDLANMQMSTLKVAPEAPVVGKSLAATRLRSEHGVTVLLVKRDGASLANPDAATVFRVGDVVVLVGESQDLAEVSHLFM
ncbi:MAG: cation:proton antiporter [Candidatus Zixiibacteriota bacterium]